MSPIQLVEQQSVLTDTNIRIKLTCPQQSQNVQDTNLHNCEKHDGENSALFRFICHCHRCPLTYMYIPVHTCAKNFLYLEKKDETTYLLAFPKFCVGFERIFYDWRKTPIDNGFCFLRQVAPLVQNLKRTKPNLTLPCRPGVISNEISPSQVTN